LRYGSTIEGNQTLKIQKKSWGCLGDDPLSTDSEKGTRESNCQEENGTEQHPTQKMVERNL